MDEMEKTILDYVIEEYIEDEDEDEEIGLDSPLISSGIVDSFSIRKYKISIPDDKATPEAFDTVRKIGKVVREIIG